LREDFRAYKTLSLLDVYAHASGNEGISIQPAKASPVLGHHPEHGGLDQVRWNTADRAGVRAAIGPSMESWYDAAA
jgi:trimethyllysine dioxygenase